MLMEQLVNIEKKNHSLKLTVREDFVEVVALLSKEQYLHLSMKSTRLAANARAVYERTVYCDFVRHIFNEPAPYIHLFSTPAELYDYMALHGIKVASNNGNGWFKTVCFDISKQNTKAKIRAYIDKKSDEFEKQEYRLP